jgi:Pyridoxamine 5'-phosphate oxidase
MGQVYDEIDAKLAAWLRAQPVYFVGTAPLAADGHVNVSPKGMAGTFAVLGAHRVGYLDYTGSGAETIAHLRENGRIVLMFCAFDGGPKIVRLHGRGRTVSVGTAEFDQLRGAFDKEQELGQRSIVVVDVDRVSDSCGFAVPRMMYAEDRDVLDRSHERREAQYFERYWARKNRESIDGLPALEVTPATS